MYYEQRVRCVGCGEWTHGDHCSDCEARYRRDQQEAYDAGEPRGIVVGRAFGGEVAIWVHEKAEHCSCRGHGWCSTDLDSWHKCPEHNTGQAHPEWA